MNGKNNSLPVKDLQSQIGPFSRIFKKKRFCGGLWPNCVHFVAGSGHECITNDPQKGSFQGKLWHDRAIVFVRLSAFSFVFFVSYVGKSSSPSAHAGRGARVPTEFVLFVSFVSFVAKRHTHEKHEIHETREPLRTTNNQTNQFSFQRPLMI